MHALQDIGVALVLLEPKRLAELAAEVALPERLHDAIREARSITAWGGRKRQLQYVGKLMRDIDPEPVRQTLERWAVGAPDDHARFAAAEHWREQVLADDAALDRFADTHPAADRAALAVLVRDARVERTRSGPPHRYRALFRALRAALDTETAE